MDSKSSVQVLQKMKQRALEKTQVNFQFTSCFCFQWIAVRGWYTELFKEYNFVLAILLDSSESEAIQYIQTGPVFRSFKITLKTYGSEDLRSEMPIY